MTTVTVGKDGRLGLPEEVLDASHIEPGAELVVIADAGRILPVDRRRLLEARMDAVDEEIRARTRWAVRESAARPFVADLSLDDYLALTDEEDRQLWERLASDSEDTTTVEKGIPPHFRPARQGRRPHSIRRAGTESSPYRDHT